MLRLSVRCGANQWRRGRLGVGDVPTFPRRCKSYRVGEEREDEELLIREIVSMQTRNVQQTVPWFLRSMPPSYFRQIDSELQKQHLQAVASLRELGQTDLSLKMWTPVDDEGTVDLTYINTGAQLGLLNSQVPENTELSKVKVFSADDNSLALNIFSFTAYNKANVELASDIDCFRLFSFVNDMRDGKFDHDAKMPKFDSSRHSRDALLSFVTRCSPAFVRLSDPRRFLLMRDLFDEVRHSESVAVHMEPGALNLTWLTIAASNVLPEVLLRLSTSVLVGHKVNVERAHLDKVHNPDYSTADDAAYVTMLRLLVNLNPEVVNVDTLLGDIQRAKWMDSAVTDLGLLKFPTLGIDKAEVVCALCSMLHGPLHKLNNHAYATAKNIVALITSRDAYLQIVDSIASLFLRKFDPSDPLSATATASTEAAILGRVKAVQSEAPRVALTKLLDACRGVLRTNFYQKDRYALSMRLLPTVMMTDASKPTPYGTYFSYGRHFIGFHNRFRDIARGGLRVVTPLNLDVYNTESVRLFDEVYGLSYGQQLKNKDIPEGGAKGVILVNHTALPPLRRRFIVRKTIRAFTDSLLDLIVAPSLANQVDLLQRDEILYLGPDEQIVPSDIDWITRRAQQRGYPIPSAFMSSKQGAGINHKHYGVTSEGIAVYLEVALKAILHIDPNTRPFTIKITGGPDGDVAGNLLRILIRDYGKNARIVGIADGSGCAEDPTGLNHAELLRLFSEAKPIVHFSKLRLSEDGGVYDATTQEGVIRRNSMHFRVKSDIFVPAGGRPNTINADNWRSFIDSDNKPSSPLIVEGANLYLNAEAREKLFREAGVAIIKDSSANKCGVIASSCEVAASMLLTEAEFMGIKEALVVDVLAKLRHLARLEAELLIREYNNFPGALPHFSERISMAISAVTDSLTEALEGLRPGDALFDELFPLVIDNLPPKLVSVAGDRVQSRFPVQYQRNAMASTLASRFVYQEGIHAVEIQPREQLAKRVMAYYREERKVRALAAAVTQSSGLDPASRDAVVDLLKRGGARTLLNTF